MATGYTTPIHDGEDVTFERFALMCARAMGAAIMQRDDPLGEPLRLREMSGHEQKNVDKARGALERAKARSDAEWEEAELLERREANNHRADYLRKREEIRARYEAMLEQVLAWEPPTAEHQGLKDFMESQLRDSIKFDCGDYAPPMVEPRSVDEYRRQELTRLAVDLSRAEHYLREEQERVAAQRAWVTALHESLDVPSTEEAGRG